MKRASDSVQSPRKQDAVVAGGHTCDLSQERLGDFGGNTVLLVDDKEINRIGCGEMLTKIG